MAMDLNAKAAYIRGMMKGMEFDPTTQEGKIIVAMMDLLEEMADVVSEHDDALDQAFDELDAIDEDMDDLVDSIFGDDDEDEDEDEDDDGAFETSYEVTCPNCGTVNIVDEDTLIYGSVCNLAAKYFLRRVRRSFRCGSSARRCRDARRCRSRKYRCDHRVSG